MVPCRQRRRGCQRGGDKTAVARGQNKRRPGDNGEAAGSPGGNRPRGAPAQAGRLAQAGRPRWAGARAQAVASARSSVRLRVLLGSTGMPGPIVVVKVTFFRYRPLAAAGLSLITSSRAAA